MKIGPQEFTFRVITTKFDDFPYQLEYKSGWWPFWKKISMHSNLDSAVFHMKNQKPSLRPGMVVAEYTPEDMVADKLRGNT